jgi:hypothetical protein
MGARQPVAAGMSFGFSRTSEFKFQVLEMRPSAARKWLITWAKRYDKEQDDDPEYRVDCETRIIFSRRT